MRLEPLPGERDDAGERAGFLVQVAGARHDLQAGQVAEHDRRLAIQAQDDRVAGADDEQRGRAQARQDVAGEVGPAAARDDCGDPVRALGRGDERGRGAGAGAVESDGQLARAGRQVADRRARGEPSRSPR